MTTKAQYIEENEQLRAQLAHTIEESRTDLAAQAAHYESRIKALNTKLFNAHSERSKREARCNAPMSGTFAERAARARQLAIDTGHSVAIGGA